MTITIPNGPNSRLMKTRRIAPFRSDGGGGSGPPLTLTLQSLSPANLATFLIANGVGPFSFNPGDGSPTVNPVPGPTVTHQYGPNAGSFTAVVTDLVADTASAPVNPVLQVPGQAVVWTAAAGPDTQTEITITIAGPAPTGGAPASYQQRTRISGGSFGGWIGLPGGAAPPPFVLTAPAPNGSNETALRAVNAAGFGAGTTKTVVLDPVPAPDTTGDLTVTLALSAADPTVRVKGVDFFSGFYDMQHVLCAQSAGFVPALTASQIMQTFTQATFPDGSPNAGVAAMRLDEDGTQEFVEARSRPQDYEFNDNAVLASGVDYMVYTVFLPAGWTAVGQGEVTRVSGPFQLTP